MTESGFKLGGLTLKSVLSFFKLYENQKGEDMSGDDIFKSLVFHKYMSFIELNDSTLGDYLCPMSICIYVGF